MTSSQTRAGQIAPCVAVVGMHRSGTSATAGLLLGLGLAGPRPDDLVPADASNERGHWESETVHLCNARLLATRGSTSYAPPPVMTRWDDRSVWQEVREQAEAWFRATSAGRPLVLKDPRLCLTLPFWREAIPTTMGAVLVLRDPLAVARSLHARDQIPMTLGLALWDRYVRSAVAGLQGMATLVMEYDVMLGDPAKATESVATLLERLGVQLDPRATESAAARLDPHLRHQTRARDAYEEMAQSQVELFDILAGYAGQHDSWQVPALPDEPPWVNDVISLRRDAASARHELHWVKASRVYRMATAVWQVMGRRPGTLVAPDEDDEP